MYHDDRVLRVMLVVDGTSSFVEWIDANVLMALGDWQKPQERFKTSVDLST